MTADQRTRFLALAMALVAGCAPGFGGCGGCGSSPTNLEAFWVPSGAMEPTLLIGDHFLSILVSEPTTPKRGSIVVFRSPTDGQTALVKRVIGVEGDEIEIRAKKVYVNGAFVEEPYVQFLDPDTTDKTPRDNFGPEKVPPDKFFAMGDNRDRSYDSRYWGFADEDDIIATPRLIYWSRSDEDGIRWGRIGTLVR